MQPEALQGSASASPGRGLQPPHPCPPADSSQHSAARAVPVPLYLSGRLDPRHRASCAAPHLFGGTPWSSTSEARVPAVDRVAGRDTEGSSVCSWRCPRRQVGLWPQWSHLPRRLEGPLPLRGLGRQLGCPSYYPQQTATPGSLLESHESSPKSSSLGSEGRHSPLTICR